MNVIAPGRGAALMRLSQHRRRPPLKVLLIARELTGDLGRHFVDLAAGLADRGLEVHCLRSSAPVTAERDAAERLASLPRVALHELPIQPAIGLNDLGAYRELRALVARCGPFDIAHGHGAKAGVLVRLPAEGLGARVYTPHGLATMDRSLPQPKRRVYGLLEGALSRLSTDAVILVAEEERCEALRLGLAPELCHVVPHGLAMPDFFTRARARRALGLSPKADVALFAGDFVQAKGPERFLRLIGQLAEQRPQLQAAMIGRGDTSPLLHQAAELGIADRLKVFETDAPAGYMKAADLLVLPSRHEGLSYSMIEGIAAGLPILSFDVAGTSMAIIQGESGYVVPQGNEFQLAMSAAAMIDSPPLRASMAAAARARFSLFDLDAMIDRTIGVYERVRAPACPQDIGLAA